VFILCWLLFPTAPSSRYFAALVPLSVALYMLANARGWTSNRGLIETVSRTGLARELSAGPFYYGLIHALAAVLFWTESPTGIVSLIILCIGDGVADLVGRPYGKHKWFYNREKSVEGSVAFAVASYAVVWTYVALFMSLGLFWIPVVSVAQRGAATLLRTSSSQLLWTFPLIRSLCLCSSSFTSS
jgi:dolichol kinase